MKLSDLVKAEDKRGTVLHVSIKQINRQFVDDQCKELNLNASLFIDKLLDSLRELNDGQEPGNDTEGEDTKGA